ncbi:MAG: VanZ family protein [Planctomycetota bacterium]|nr:VanZ family protein [Planctomycetota bacterium]
MAVSSLVIIRGSGRLAVALPRSFWFATATAWAGGIYYLSSLSSPPSEPSYLWAWIANMAHAPLYGLLALWLALALPRADSDLGHKWSRLDPKHFHLVLWSVVAYAVLDELHQGAIAGRDASPYDLLTDFCAAFITLKVATAAVQDVTPKQMNRRLIRGVLVCCLAGLAATFG